MIIIINPNSTVAMTDAMVRTARDTVKDIQIEGWTSLEGPAAIQGPEDGAAAVAPMLELVKKAVDAGAQAIIIGCFDDIGLAEAREIAPCPVIGIGQAAYHFAALAGPRFSVVTTLPESVQVLQDNIQTYGLDKQLVRVRPSGVPVLDLETDPINACGRVLDEIGVAIAEDNVQSVILGCAGMVDISDMAGDDYPVRLIDGVRAAIQFGAML